MLERALHPASCETLRGLLPDRSSPLLSERGFVPLAACAAPRTFVLRVGMKLQCWSPIQIPNSPKGSCGKLQEANRHTLATENPLALGEEREQMKARVRRT